MDHTARGMIVLVLAGAGLLASVAAGASVEAGQGAAGTAPALVADLTLEEGLAQSVAQRRLLVVFVVGNNRGRMGEAEAWFASPGAAAWAARHAIVVRVTDAAKVRTLAQAKLVQPAGADPLVFREGRSVRMFAGGPPGRGPSTPRVRGPRDAGGSFAGPVLRLHWTLRGLARTDRAWYEAHVAAAGGGGAGGSKPAGARTFAAMEGLGAAAVGEAGPEEFFPRLREARRLAASTAEQDLARATGLYTWLWEHAAAEEGEIAPAAVALLSPEMHALGVKSEPARQRWGAMRDGLQASLEWDDWSAVFRWVMLSRAAQDYEANLAFIDDALNDTDALKMLPRSDREALDTVLRQAHWLAPTGTDLATRVERSASKLAESRPGSEREEDWRRLMDVRRLGLRVEGARLYASLLARDRAEEGATVAAALLAKDGAAEAKASLVAAALFAGKAGPIEAGWLDDVERAAGRPSSILRAGLAMPAEER